MKRLLIALSIVVLTLGGAGCSKAGSSGTQTGVLRIGLPVTPTNLNAILSQNTTEVFVDGMVYSALVTIDDKGTQIPDLARTVPTLENGGISKDGRTITYHLRHGVVWHDGAPFTSKDVAFTWHAIMNPANNVVARHGYDDVASVATPDAFTVVFLMKRLFPPAIDTLFGASDSPYFVLPEHLLARYPNINRVPFNAAPVGTGPFKVSRWLRGDRIVLIPNDRYFLGKPKLARIDLKLIPDANTTEAQLRGHDIDLAFELTGTNYRDFKNDAAFVRHLAHAPTFAAIVFNTSRPPLDDVRVRKALALAIDAAAITQKNTYGAGSLATADLSPFYWAFDPALKPVPYDPKGAAALLDAAGWKAGPNGIRSKNGTPLSLQLTFGQGSQLVRNVIAQVQAYWKPLGVDVGLKSYDYSVLFAAASSGGIFNSGSYDTALYSWTAGADPDNSSQWLSSNVPPNGNDITRYSSGAMDAAQRTALSTFDRGVRKRAYSQIESLLLRDVPARFIYYNNERFVYAPQLQGFAPNGIDAGWNAYRWSI